MSSFRALIVDDVPLARERVRLYLQGEPDIAVAGEAATGADAVRMIASLAPDLVFLDVQLPDFDGFDIANRLPPEHRPVIIYLTAHDDKAIHAFEAGALDYLVKPFDRERFARALNRARDQLRLRAGQIEPAKPEYHNRLAIKDRGRTEIVSTIDIDYIDAAGHYVCVHVGRKVHLIRSSLGEIEQKLDPAEFARVHRSAIVRLDRIASVTARRNGDGDIALTCGGVLLLSRTYAENLRARLQRGS